MGWFTETKYVPYEKAVSVNKTVHNHLAPAAEQLVFSFLEMTENMKPR